MSNNSSETAPAILFGAIIIAFSIGMCSTPYEFQSTKVDIDQSTHLHNIDRSLQKISDSLDSDSTYRITKSLDKLSETLQGQEGYFSYDEEYLKQSKPERIAVALEKICRELEKLNKENNK